MEVVVFGDLEEMINLEVNQWAMERWGGAHDEWDMNWVAAEFWREKGVDPAVVSTTIMQSGGE